MHEPIVQPQEANDNRVHLMNSTFMVMMEEYKSISEIEMGRTYVVSVTTVGKGRFCIGTVLAWDD
jgi:hypothetical protein